MQLNVFQISAFHTLSLLHFALPHFQRPRPRSETEAVLTWPYLTFDLSASKLGQGSPVSWASFLPIFSFLCPSILDLKSAARDRQTDRQRRRSLTLNALNVPSYWQYWGRGIKIYFGNDCIMNCSVCNSRWWVVGIQNKHNGAEKLLQTFHVKDGPWEVWRYLYCKIYITDSLFRRMNGVHW